LNLDPGSFLDLAVDYTVEDVRQPTTPHRGRSI